ncbi:MAG TPA: ornithine cyclodeaminase family protein [Marmoricola sp.]|nr:ornithine cyclodeaminase family protein [Marmoricola sp.]
MTSPLPFLDAEAIGSALDWVDAVEAVERALLDGLDPASAAERTILDVAHGQLLLMPAETAGAVGVKLASVSPTNPGRGLPRIQALYLLLDHETLAPRALMDGTALTTVRTPAVSAVAVKHLAPLDARRLVVFGSGPQAWGHVQAMRAIRPLESVVVVGRDSGRAEELAARISADGLTAGVGHAGAVEKADIVVCATSARFPLFDGALLGPEACVVAVGSHEPELREVDAHAMERAATGGGVVVETVPVALREAGDVVLAIDDGALGADDLVGIGELVQRPDRRRGVSVFKSCGMGWQDLVVAEAALDRWSAQRA